MTFGVAYYPEHWPETRWAEDARQMRSLGLDTVRIGEFAWSRLEPEEGRFDFEWLDRAISSLTEQDLNVVLGTPTASPPAWLVESYPQSLPVDENGQRRSFGARRHYCPNQPDFLRLSQRIVEKMGAAYGDDARVIGWQIDNEFGEGDTARCYCAVCNAAFQAWLREKYGSLEALNAAWGTVFWSQEYSRWEQIPIPLRAGPAPNPSQQLDYFRFASYSFEKYLTLQVETLRPLIAGSRQFLTHNFMGIFSELNYHKLVERLDFAAWDSYPTGNQEHWGRFLYGAAGDNTSCCADLGDPLITGMAHDITRGLLGKEFWVMEQQPGAINWSQNNQGIQPGAVRLWTWQALGHGASNILYFRWRASPLAQEQYHAGLLRHDATPAVGYQDLLQMRNEWDLLTEFAAQPVESAQVALLVDYDSLWALEIQPHSEGFSYWKLIFRYYRALMQLGIPVDLVPADRDLTPYRLVIAPSAHVASSQTAERLVKYVKDRGSLLLGIRSGFKLPSNQVETRPLPGVFRYLAGTVVMDWQAVHPKHPPQVVSPINDLGGPAYYWVEQLEPDQGTEVLARYSSGPYTGKAALTHCHFGNGRTFYLGWFPEVHQVQGFIARVIEELGIDRLAHVPPGVIVRKRGDQLLLLNFCEQPLNCTVNGLPVNLPPREVHLRALTPSFVPRNRGTRPLRLG